MNKCFSLSENLTFLERNLFSVCGTQMIGVLIKLQHLVWAASDSFRQFLITELAFSHLVILTFSSTLVC